MTSQTINQELVSSITPENSTEVQRPPERLPNWKECMAYGSERFETATANNHNIVMLVESPIAQKVVLNKDVVLTLPQNPENLDLKAGYPTHQDAWLPLWYIAAYHSQAKTPQELEYQREALSRVSPEDFALVRSALAYKAYEFLQEYKTGVTAKPLSEVAEDEKAIRKRFKPMTRVLQDIMLYADMRKQAISSHDEFLQRSPIAGLVIQTNALRRGEGLDSAAQLEQQIEQVITNFVQDCGGLEAARQAYEQLSNQLGSSENGSVYVVDKDTVSIEQGPLYAHLVNPSLTLAVDEHDHDVISVVPGLTEPKFFQIEERFGNRLAKSRRLDVIAIPEDVGPYDLVSGGKESFQSIAMMIVTHTSINNETGRKIQERLETQFSPEDLAKHYLGAAKEFMDGYAWGKSYAVRSENADIPQVKKSIPLHRVGRDLLPRAIYMLKTGEFPHDVPDDKLWEETGLTEVAKGIDHIWETQDATDEELAGISEQIRTILANYYTKECTGVFERNLKTMGTSIDVMKGAEANVE